LNIFQIANNISNSKQDISGTEEFKKVYSQYMINYILSLAPDTVLFANEMNQFSKIPDEFHYLFYHGALHKKSRYFKYPKQSVMDIETLNVVKEYFTVDDDKARDILELIDSEIIEKIKKSYGGVRK